VKKALGRTTRHTGLTQVTAPNEQDGCHCYSTQLEIKKACLEEATCQFTQAKDTPMLQSPMLDLFGIDKMDMPEFSQILDGTFQCPKECDPYLQKLLPHIQKLDGIPTITIQMYEDYKNRWEKA